MTTDELELIETVPVLKAEIAALKAELAVIQCHYCGKTFMPNDPHKDDHWRVCERHPARAEINRLQAEVNELKASLQIREMPQ